MGYLLDTNVVSELSKDVPHPGVLTLLQDERRVWLSSVVIHEIEFGLQLLPVGRRRDSLRRLHINIMSLYSDHVLDLDRSAAEWSAKLRARARKSGFVIDLGDALIAGTAMANDLSVVTRNVSDFEALGVDVLDPWASD